MTGTIVDRIIRKWTRIRLQPIRVYCLHHVTEQFDGDSMHQCDWMSVADFKKAVYTLRTEGVEFISITEACHYLKKDIFRSKKYAVITFDDGWDSTRNIIMWLCEQQIPVTLFLNPAYINGEEKREIGMSMVQKELNELLNVGDGLITIASHGWNHTLCTDLSMSDFEKSVNQSEAYLKKYDEYIPFFAYPCGCMTKQQDEYLMSKNIVPVYMDGKANYNDATAIHREALS